MTTWCWPDAIRSRNRSGYAPAREENCPLNDHRNLARHRILSCDLRTKKLEARRGPGAGLTSLVLTSDENLRPPGRIPLEIKPVESIHDGQVISKLPRDYQPGRENRTDRAATAPENDMAEVGDAQRDRLQSSMKTENVTMTRALTCSGVPKSLLRIFAPDTRSRFPHGVKVLEWLHEVRSQSLAGGMRVGAGPMLSLRLTRLNDRIPSGENWRHHFLPPDSAEAKFFPILDEHTNHLGPGVDQRAELALQKYDGTGLLVTTTYWWSNVGHSHWHIEHARWDDFMGRTRGWGSI